MLFQAIAEMEEEDFSKAAYVKLRTTDTMRDVTDDLDKLHRDLDGRFHRFRRLIFRHLYDDGNEDRSVRHRFLGFLAGGKQ